jgi:hypoxanthine phosphoribosyltransferase
MNPIVCLIDEHRIRTRLAELGLQITADLRHCHRPLIVGVLTGAWVFMADLVRQLDIDVECDFVRLATYGARTSTTGTVKVEHLTRADFAGRHVLIVEDIVDTGTSAKWLRAYFGERAASVRFCTLLNKPARRISDVVVEYIGFDVPDRFVVGYGIDFAESYRNLPFIGVIADDLPPSQAIR